MNLKKCVQKNYLFVVPAYFSSNHVSICIDNINTLGLDSQIGTKGTSLTFNLEESSPSNFCTELPSTPESRSIVQVSLCYNEHLGIELD